MVMDPRNLIAERAGVDRSYVDRLFDAGVLTSADALDASPGAVRRVRLILGLERAGLPIDSIGQAMSNGAVSFAFLDHPVFDRFAGLTVKTFRTLSDETGIPTEVLTALREALGFAQPNLDDQMREDELLIVPVIERQLAKGLKPAVIQRWLRVYGDSARRMAETEADWWRTEIEAPLIESGIGEGKVLDIASEWGAQIAPFLDQAVLALYHGHEEHAWLKNIIENVETALDDAGLRSRLTVPPTMCFLDITGYTRLTEERGDTAAAELASRLGDMVQRTSQAHSGKPVKWLGDGVMIYFRDPAGAVPAALDIVDKVADAGLPPAHVGMHAGPVVFQSGDYFGRTVNLAARIAAYARPGEILVSKDVMDAAQNSEILFTEVGLVELKGVAGSVHLYAARRGP